MPTLQLTALRAIAASGLAALRLSSTARPDGTWYFRGERPGPAWHAHGVLIVQPRDLRDGALPSIRVAKQRWKNAKTGATCHSRPPDDVGRRYTATVIAIALFVWIDAGIGLLAHTRLFPAFDRIHDRTLLRWLKAAAPCGRTLQTAVRRALLDLGTSPEALFPRGLSPPDAERRPWRAPGQVSQLHRGLRMALGAAVGMKRPAAGLLAEAHRRTPHEPFLIG